MTPSEAAKILAVAAVYDRRTVGELDAKAWADALDDLDPRECAEAVRTHYRGSTAWIMPAHVRVIVDGKRRDAAERRRSQRVLRELESAAEQFDPAATRSAAEEARRAFAEAIAARKTGGSA